jgi:hypothetical protein
MADRERHEDCSRPFVDHERGGAHRRTPRMNSDRKLI